MKHILLALLVAMTPLHAALLWKSGAPTPPIVVSKDAPLPARQAAEELAYWLGRATETNWRVVEDHQDDGTPAIYIGEAATRGVPGAPKTDALPHDGYWMKAEGGTLRIAGRDYAGGIVKNWLHPMQTVDTWNPQMKLSSFGDMGTWEGVHQFLESLGFRWYMPGELGTIVPELTEIRFDDIEKEVSPAFEYRYAWLCNFEYSPLDALWYRRIGYGAPKPVNIGHSYYFFTTEYGETHPEYFALVDGQRDLDDLCASGGGMLCLSNEDVIDAWIKIIREFFEEYPDTDLFPVCPNDNLARICGCEACQSQLSPQLDYDGLFSNYIWGFNVKLAKRLAKELPGKRIACFAYSKYRAIPDCIDELPENLAVMICYKRQDFRNPYKKQHIRELIAEWGRLATGGIYLWTYPHLNYWEPWRGYPRFYPHLLAEDVRANSRLPVLGEFLESESYQHNEPDKVIYDFHFPALNHLTAYLASKLLWNPELDVDALLDEYYKLFYGDAAPLMKEYWELVERITMKGNINHPMDHYTIDEAKAVMEVLDNAFAATKEGSREWQRIKLMLGEIRLRERAKLNPKEQAPFKIALSEELIPIDGTQWKDAVRYEMVTKMGENPAVKTEVLAIADREGVAFSFTCHEPVKRELTVDARRHDDPRLYLDDSVEAFFCRPDQSNAIHFIINADGFCADYTWPNSEDSDDISWNSSGLKTFNARGDGFWSVQFKIPWKDIGLEGPEGADLVGILYRNRPFGGKDEFSALVPTYSYAHRVPSLFPKVLFVTPEK